jgi:hypothetical protein
MAILASLLRLLRAITVSAAFMIAAPAIAAGSGLAAAAPQGFEDLTADRELVLDAYFGGRKIGEVQARVSPGALAFAHPDLVADMVPDVADPTALASALSGPLPANVALACGPEKREGCGSLRPERAGVIFDEARFRVEIFVHPDLLARPDPSAASYLPGPDGGPSLVSLFGATLSGSSRGEDSWHLQNRTIASIGSVRLRSDSSLSGQADWTFDNLSVEADRGDWRYAGGLFWAPGTDVIGRRKIMGLGLSTQLDTRVEREAMMATPLTAFLQQPGKVDLLVDGRILSSHIYPAGNRLIDTASLPNGSYEVMVRIQEDGRPPREERQFFTKGTPIAPAGRPLLSAFAGFIPKSGNGLSLESDTFFYEATAAYRMGPGWGLDAAVIGTQDKAIVQAGGILLTRLAQVRAAALVSSSADHGVLLRVSSVGSGPLSLSFDLRRIHSHDGGPLLPVTASRGTFSEDPETGFADRGSYTQLLSIVGYRLGQANLRLTGLYRRNGSDPSTYSLGASCEVPVVRSDRWDILLQGDVRKTESGFASFLGLRLLANRGKLAYSGSAGVSHRSGSPDRSTRVVGEAQAAWYRQLGDQSQLSANAALGRDDDGSYARASAFARMPIANARADLLHQFADHGDTTQYSATLDGGIVMAGGRVALAAREMNDTAIIVSASGGEPGQTFDVLVDDVARATVANGERAALFLQPYQRYEVRLRPRGGLIANFDTAPRQVTLYPGSVARLDWRFKPLFILFGRAIDAGGRPLADAEISWPDGIGRTDSEGYFQIETSGGSELRLNGRDGRSCTVTIGTARPSNGYYPAGELTCR